MKILLHDSCDGELEFPRSFGTVVDESRTRSQLNCRLGPLPRETKEKTGIRHDKEGF